MQGVGRNWGFKASRRRSQAADRKCKALGLGRPFDDGLLLKVSNAYEQSTTWHTRRPPI
jgi:hypothetical protein